MDGKRPYGHGKHTGGGSVHVGRGGRASSGPVGNGGRGGFSGSGSPLIAAFARENSQGSPKQPLPIITASQPV